MDPSESQVDAVRKILGLMSPRRQALELALVEDPLVLHLYTIGYDVNDGLIPLWGIVYNRNVDRCTLLEIYWQIWPELDESDKERVDVDPGWDWYAICDAIEKRCRALKKVKCRYAMEPHLKPVMLEHSSRVPSYMTMGHEGIVVADDYIDIPDSYWKGGAYPIPGGDAFKYWYEDRMSSVLVAGLENRFRLSEGIESVQFDTVADDLGSLSLWAGEELELKGSDVCVLHNRLDGEPYQNDFKWHDVEMLQVHQEGKPIVFDTPWKETIRQIGMEV